MLGFILFLFPIPIQAEELNLMPQEGIAEAFAFNPLTEAELNDLLGEDPSIGETDWRGNKVQVNELRQQKERATEINWRIKLITREFRYF